MFSQFCHPKVQKNKRLPNDSLRLSVYVFGFFGHTPFITYTGLSDYATYGYDDLSRLTSAVNQNGTIAFTYDNRNRLQTETDVFGHVMSYSYDAAGRRTGLNIDSTPQTTYAYDVANRLTALTDEASNNFTFAYDNANRLASRVMPNGVTSTYAYDGMSRLTRLKDDNSTGPLFDRQYSYNSANQISQIADLTNTRNFTYDNINRLTDVSVSASSVENYGYDAVGNRTTSHLSSSYTTGSFNRLTATSSATIGYNSNGSMTSKALSGSTWSYSWNRENQLSSASDGTSNVSYLYDALGRRVKRTGGSNVSKYSYDGNDVVLDDDNSTLTKYQNGLGIDGKLKQVSGGTSKYFLADHLGSTNALTNGSGTVSESNSYDSFGNATNLSFSSRYQYTGREVDGLTGIDHYRARSYDPNTGRFISEDPIGFSGGDVDLYGYVRNNPANLKDPTGLLPFPTYSNISFRPLMHTLFGDGGYLSGPTLSEFISANERSKRKCKTTWSQRFKNDFYTTNAALPGLGAPSIVPGVGLGALTSGATADALQTMTFMQWARAGFSGSVSGAATFTAAETGVGVAVGSAINFTLVTIAYESGVAIGSGVNATFGFSDYCPCGE